jgi:hypothetical protein
MDIQSRLSDNERYFTHARTWIWLEQDNFLVEFQDDDANLIMHCPYQLS